MLAHPFVFAKVKMFLMIGDGQVTQGVEIIKPNMQKNYKLGVNVIGGCTNSLVATFLPTSNKLTL